MLGSVAATRLDRLGFPGNDWLAGVADNASVTDPDFFARWLARIPGRNIDLMCHPGFNDPTLAGRDGTESDGGFARRVRELELLSNEAFPNACARAGFTLTAPSALARTVALGGRHAA
jgi:hypothetical protein